MFKNGVEENILTRKGVKKVNVMTNCVLFTICYDDGIKKREMGEGCGTHNRLICVLSVGRET
jgi:hypothetical protein